MAAVSEEKWKEAFEAVKAQFALTDLLPEQQEAIKAFFRGKNVLVNLPTGFGKSLIFQSLPIAVDIVCGKPRGSSVIVVIGGHFTSAVVDGGPWAILEQHLYSSYCHHRCRRSRNYSASFKREFSRSIRFARVFVVYRSMEGNLQKRKLLEWQSTRLIV